MYNSIENLPIRIWHKIHSDKDVSLLSSRKKFSENDLKLLNELWENIIDEYFKKYGVPEELENLINTKKRIAILKADYIIYNKRHLLTLAEIEMNSIKYNNRVENKKSLEENLAILSRSYGFKISSRDTTVDEYYSYVKSLENGRK